MTPHPLAIAYLRAFAAAHHARGHVVPTGMPSPAMQMHRARDAWQRAGCPLEAEAAPRPVTVPCQLAADDGWTGAGVVVRVTRWHLHVACGTAEKHGQTSAYGRKTGRRVYWPNMRVINPKDVVGEWLLAKEGWRVIRPTYTAAPEDPVLDRMLALPAGINPGSKLGSTMDRKPTAYRLDHEPGSLGDLDLAAEGTIRIERMGDASMWIRVEHEGGAVVINLHAKGGKLRQTVEIEPAHNNPTTHKDNP